MKTKFILVRRCVSCNTKLSMQEMYYSDGCCPYCGHNSRSTICDTKDTSEEITVRAWWFRELRPLWAGIVAFLLWAAFMSAFWYSCTHR